MRSDPDPTFDIKICISFASSYFEFVPCVFEFIKISTVLMALEVGSGIFHKTCNTNYGAGHLAIQTCRCKSEFLVTFTKPFKALKVYKKCPYAIKNCV